MPEHNRTRSNPNTATPTMFPGRRLFSTVGAFAAVLTFGSSVPVVPEGECAASGTSGAAAGECQASSNSNSNSEAAATVAGGVAGAGKAPLGCLDRPNWVDSYGYTCKLYADGQYCTADGGFGPGWDPSWGSDYRAYTSADGIDATQACCACGGGLRIGAKPKAKAQAQAQAQAQANAAGTARRAVKAAGEAAAASSAAPAVPEPQAHPPTVAGSGAFGAGVVHELDEATFPTFLGDAATAVVMFYAPWCGACKNFKPVFDATAAAMGAGQHDAGTTGIRFARVDATAFPKLQRRYKVSSYPTVNIFRGGDPNPVHTKLSARSQPDLTAALMAAHSGKPLPAGAAGGSKAQRKPKTDPKTKPAVYQDIEPANSAVRSFDAAGLRAAVRAEPQRLFVVKLYAEWCSHCRQVFPEFTGASVALRDHEDPAVREGVVLAKVNVHDPSGVNDMMTNYYSVKGTPAFIVFRNGDPDTVYNFDVRGDQRDAEHIAAYAADLFTGRVALPAPQQRYCVPGSGEPDPADEVCFFEMPCTKQTWDIMNGWFQTKGWSADTVSVSGEAEFDNLVRAKPNSWVLFSDESTCVASVMLRVAFELGSNREQSVDSLDAANRALWNVIIVRTADPANAPLLARYVPGGLRPEGQAVRVVSAEDVIAGRTSQALDMDMLMYPLAPSLPEHPLQLYVLGVGMIKTIWTLRLNGALFEHWGSPTLEQDLRAVIEEQWDDFLGDGKRDFIEEDFVEWQRLYRQFRPRD